MPARDALATGDQAMRGDVADDSREVALGVPAQVAKDKAQGLRKFGRPGKMRRREKRAAIGERAQRRVAGQRDGDLGRSVIASNEQTERADRQRQAQRPELETGALPGEGPQAIARPALAGQQMVDGA